MIETEVREAPKKRNPFKWFISILGFILIIFFIISVNRGSNNSFDSCYDQCISMGNAPKSDGTCETGYQKKNNWCIKDGRANTCINKCTASCDCTCNG